MLDFTRKLGLMVVLLTGGVGCTEEVEPAPTPVTHDPAPELATDAGAGCGQCIDYGGGIVECQCPGLDQGQPSPAPPPQDPYQ